MLTGFHGLHVTIGAIMLFVIWARVLKRALHAEAAFRVSKASRGTGTSSTSCGSASFIFVYWL